MRPASADGRSLFFDCMILFLVSLVLEHDYPSFFSLAKRTTIRPSVAAIGFESLPEKPLSALFGQRPDTSVHLGVPSSSSCTSQTRYMGFVPLKVSNYAITADRQPHGALYEGTLELVERASYDLSVLRKPG